MSIQLPRTAIAAVLASTLLLAGCSDDGGNDDKGDSGNETSQTSDPGADASDDSEGSGETGETGETGGDSEALDKDSFYQTVIDAQVEAGSFKGTTITTVAGTSMTMNMEASYEDGKLASKSTSAPGSATSLEAILVDNAFYLRGEGFGAPAGKWLKIDGNDKSDPMSQMVRLADPETTIKAFDDPTELKLVGSEDVDGVEADHYTVTIDSATFAKNLDMAEIASALPPELTFDMWLDSENRPVKMHQEVEVQGQTTTTESFYTDYGSEVDIEAPAEADTVTR